MIEILVILGLIVLNGIFSMSEIAVVSSNKIRLENEAEEGDKKAKEALDLARSPNEFLSTVQIGITLIGIVSGVFGGASLAEKLNVYLSQISFLDKYSETVSYVIIIFLITYLSLVIGELLPKRLGLLSPETVAKTVAAPMKIISRITTPFVWLLSVSTNGLLKLFRVKDEKEETISDEEITAMIEKGTETGEFEEVEHDIVESLFFLSDRNVGSLMKSRMDIVTLDINDEEEIRKKISDHPYYIYPVYENATDTIIGILNSKKVLSKIFHQENINFRKLLDAPLFVHEKLEALKLLEEFKRNRRDFAVVLDEFGHFTGIVTLRDLFDALVGNGEGNSHSEGEIIQRSEKSWLVDGMISFDEFIRYFEFPNDELHKQHDFYTLGGFVLYITRHIPQTGEKFEWEGYQFEVIDMDGFRIDKVLVTKL